MNQRVRVFWDSENEWFEGIVDQVDERRGYHVSYHDGDEEWIHHEDMHDPHLVQFIDEVVDHTEHPANPREDDSEEEEVLIVEERKFIAPTTSHTSSINILADDNHPEDHPDDDDDIKSDQVMLGAGKSNYPSPHTAAVDDMESVRSSAPSVSYLEYHDVVLAKGKIHYASHLPKPPQDDRDARVFFRILFAGGENTMSALFQCKTPVFESNMALEVADRVDWTSNSFKFEIDKVGSQEDIPARGDVIVAIYRQRSYGGNEFIGQAVINVARLCQEGSKGRGVVTGCPVETRGVRTALQLYDRSGSNPLKNARVAVEISLSWKVDSLAELETNQIDVISSLRPRSALQSLFKASSRQKSRSSGLGAAPSAGSHRQMSGSRLGRNAAVANKPARSRMNKAQKEFQWKVERENKSMQSRLAKHALKSQEPGRLSVYGGGKAGPLAALRSVPESNTKERSEAKADDPEDEEYRRLLSLHTQLKADIAAVTEENKALSARLSTLLTQSKQWQISSERSSKSAAADPKSAPPAGGECVNFVGLLEKGLKTAGDLELREMLEEYKYLQETRRSLRARISTARKTLSRNSSDAAQNLSVVDRFKRLVVEGDSSGDFQGGSSTVLNKLEEAKLELLRLRGIQDLELHLSHIYDARDELIGLQSHLENRIEQERKTFDGIVYERDLAIERLASIKNEGMKEAWREKYVSVRNDIIRQRIERALPPSLSINELL